MTRRHLLQLLASAPAASLLRSSTSNAASVALAHGLLFGDDDVPRMRRLYAGHRFFVSLRERIESIDRSEMRRWMANDVRYNDHLTDIRRLGDTAESMALHFLMTGDEDAADLARACVELIMRFPKWDFFLDGDRSIGVQRAPAATIAVTLTSDWLGDALPTARRREWLQTVAERGCEACYLGLYGIRNPREVVGWRFDPESTILTERPGNFTDMNRRPEITQTTNLRAAPACGLLHGAAAYRDVFGQTDDQKRWVEMGAHAVHAVGDIYKPDGSYDEGVSYADYTSEQLTHSITVLLRKEGMDLRNVVNWEGYVDYATNMSMATTADPYEIVNFGDNGNPKTGQAGTVARTSAPLWIAKEFGSESAQWFAENLGGSADIRALAFFHEGTRWNAPASGNQLWECDLDWVVARTGFDADDLVVAMRSGGPANHEHADRNSIVIKCFGEQLVTDPYRPPYSFADPAWHMRLTEGHSAVLIDGHGHEHHNGVEGTNASQSWARIVTSESNDRYASWVSDASQPYRLVDLKIASVVRSVAVLYQQRAVVVVDRVVKREDAATVQARFFGFNWDGNVRQSVHGNSDGFSVSRPGAVLRASCFCNSGLRVERGKLDIPEPRASRHPFIGVSSTSPAMETLLVTAMRIDRHDAPGAAPEIRRDEESVGVTIADADVRISMDGAITVL